jgi:glycosyltransferase involved in cell wall biosynthesis
MSTTQAQPQITLGERQRQAVSWLVAGANLDPRFGGVSSVVGPLCSAVSEAGQYQILLASFGASGGESTPGYSGTIRREFPLANSGWLPGSQSWQSLGAEVRSADGVHIHGIWQKHCALTAFLARRLRKPYLISAHGMLDGWALGNKRLKKMIYSGLVENRNLRQAACLHALTQAEAADYRKLAPTIPAAVIPNGVSIPGGTPDLFFERFPQLEGRTIVLFLGRIHYKKGLDILCRSWPAISRRFPDAHLVLAGPDFENTRASIESLVDELRIRSSVTFTGMLKGSLKWSALAAADLFVLPSYSEGFSVSVLEALGMGLPVVISEQCHVPEVSTRGCGWVIQPSVNELEAALRGALAVPAAERKRMGTGGWALVNEKYSWPVIGSQMASVYDWMLGGSRPDCVQFN